MYYTGIGSRKTPAGALEKMHRIGEWMAQQGFTLRSGAADGADTAFEEGCDMVGGAKEIYLPWRGFNGHPSPLYEWALENEAHALAASIHPNWGACSQSAKQLHSRNCYQVLGYNLDSPSQLLICWTPRGEIVGGTATAIKIAKKFEIPVFNLALEDNIMSLRQFMKEII
jgi:hypothetical protein